MPVARIPRPATVTVTSINNDPEPQPDELATEEDVPLLTAGADLIANDFDGDGDPLEIVSVRNGFGGQVQLNANQTVLFTPSANFFGEARYFYTVDDGRGGQSEQEVSVQVSPVNDAPTARNDKYSNDQVFFLNGQENQPLVIEIAQLLNNDGDIDSAVIELETISFAEFGSVQIVGTTVVFTPDPDHWGEAEFRYVISDDAGLVDDAIVTMFFEPDSPVPPVAAPGQCHHI